MMGKSSGFHHNLDMAGNRTANLKVQVYQDVMPCQMVYNQSSWLLDPENKGKYVPPKVSNCLADTRPNLMF